MRLFRTHLPAFCCNETPEGEDKERRGEREGRRKEGGKRGQRVRKKQVSEKLGRKSFTRKKLGTNNTSTTAIETPKWDRERKREGRERGENGEGTESLGGMMSEIIEVPAPRAFSNR